MTETQLLTSILEQLRIISSTLSEMNAYQSAQPATPEGPTEHQSMQQQQIVTRTPFNSDPVYDKFCASDASQPPPPSLSPNYLKWTPEMEQVLLDCADADPNTPYNSITHALSLLPEGTQVSAIRNKCSKLGLKVSKGAILYKETT